MKKSLILAFAAASLAAATPVLAQAPARTPSQALVAERVAAGRANVEAWTAARQTWRGNAAGEAVAGRRPAVLLPSSPVPGYSATFGGNGG
jgi:hypothetical protein